LLKYQPCRSYKGYPGSCPEFHNFQVSRQKWPNDQKCKNPNLPLFAEQKVGFENWLENQLLKIYKMVPISIIFEKVD